eukprot:2504082-Karenia_brevis.AAC.1
MQQARACSRHARLHANNTFQARTCMLQERVPAEKHALQARACLQQASAPAEKNALQARACLQQARVPACK